MFNPLEEERVVQPALGRLNARYRSEAYFRVQVFGQVLVQGAFQDGCALGEILVFLFQLHFAHYNSNTLLVYIGPISVVTVGIKPGDSPN